MFGIGPAEILIFSCVCLFTFGVPLAVIFLLLRFLKQRRAEHESICSAINQLREENQRLREDLAAVSRKLG
jgi:hypothetical protein